MNVLKVGEYITLDGIEMTVLLQRGEVTVTELIEASYQRLAAVNDRLNAVTYTRKEKALQEAKAWDERSNRVLGNFARVPIFLKDISQTIKGEPSTAGSRIFQEAIAPHTAYFVEKLLSAGFISLGNSTTPEFALKNITEAKLNGPTRNPWHLDYSPGGSSGGAAALVASGVVPIAGASDGGGSIRIPASFTGLVGLKPTRGRTPVGPGVGRQWHGAAIDFVLTRTVRDAARSLDHLQVEQQAAAFQTPLFPGQYEATMKKDFSKPLRIGFTTASPVGTPVSDDAKEAVRKTVAWLEAQGHIVEEVDNGIDGAQLMRDYFLMNSGEMAAMVQQIETMRGEKLTADDVEIETWLLHRAGQQVSAAAFTLSLASWDVAAEKMALFHETYDFYLTPATAFPAPKTGELTHSKDKENCLREQIEGISVEEQQELIYDMFLPSLTYTPFTQLANLTGQPAISLPVHVTEKGLPLGVQVMAAKGEEHRLLQLADKIEQSDIWIGMLGNPMYQN